MGEPTRPVILDRRWDVRSLLVETVVLFWRHKLLFMTITAIVTVPYVVVVDLLTGEALANGTIDPDQASFILPNLLGATVVPALITALHVVAVLRIAEGERPSVREALVLAAGRAPAAVGATLLYCAVVAVGVLALVIPGIWLAVRLYFGAQAAVVDRLGPVQALYRSSDLVRNRWWVTLGRLLLAFIAFSLVMALLAIPLGYLDFGVAYVAVDALAHTVGLSLTALFGTLVFMDYRQPELTPPADSGSARL